MMVKVCVRLKCSGVAIWHDRLKLGTRVLVRGVIDRREVLELPLFPSFIGFKVLQEAKIGTLDLVNRLDHRQSRTDQKGEKGHRPDVGRLDAVSN